MRDSFATEHTTIKSVVVFFVISEIEVISTNPEATSKSDHRGTVFIVIVTNLQQQLKK